MISKGNYACIFEVETPRKAITRIGVILNLKDSEVDMHRHSFFAGHLHLSFFDELVRKDYFLITKAVKDFVVTLGLNAVALVVTKRIKNVLVD